METWYRVNKYYFKKYSDNLFCPITVEKETEKCIWYAGVKCLKKTSYENYFKTLQEAKEFALNRAQDRLKHAKERLEDAKSEIEHIMSYDDEATTQK